MSQINPLLMEALGVATAHEMRDFNALLGKIDVPSEVELIKKKKSNLSARERRWVINYWERSNR